MKNSLNYVGAALFALTLIAAGCSARTGPIRGESSVQGDGAATESHSDTSTDKSTGRSSSGMSGGASGSGSASGSVGGN
jgi:hypothetical protein